MLVKISMHIYMHVYMYVNLCLCNVFQNTPQHPHILVSRAMGHPLWTGCEDPLWELCLRLHVTHCPRTQSTMLCAVTLTLVQALCGRQP